MKKIRNLFLVAAVIAAAVSFPVFGESLEAAGTGVPAEAAVFAEGVVSAPEEAAVFAEAAESVPEELTEAAGAMPAEATGADASLPAEVTDAKLAGGREDAIQWFLTDDPNHAGFYRLSMAADGPVPETGVIASGSFDMFDCFLTADEVPWKDYKEKISSVRIGSEDDIVTVRNAAYWFSGCTALTDVCVDRISGKEPLDIVLPSAGKFRVGHLGRQGSISAGRFSRDRPGSLGQFLRHAFRGLDKNGRFLRCAYCALGKNGCFSGHAGFGRFQRLPENGERYSRSDHGSDKE